MMRSILVFAIVMGLGSAVATAQNASPRKPAEPRIAATTNIQVQITVTDHVGSEAPIQKTVSMVVADNTAGRIRASGQPALPVLNVDATPVLQKDRIGLRLTLEYRAPSPKPEEPSMPIYESLTVLLENGKPLTVTQAADPSRDRRVTVEVTATTLK